jgi:hypothetical protein
MAGADGPSNAPSNMVSNASVTMRQPYSSVAVNADDCQLGLLRLELPIAHLVLKQAPWESPWEAVRTEFMTTPVQDQAEQWMNLL